MWDYNRINKEKEALCLREGIDESRRDEFKDMGNESPLFRCVFEQLIISQPIYSKNLYSDTPSNIPRYYADA